MSRLSVLLGGLFILLVAGGVYLFLQNFERVPEEEWIGPSAEARQNPLLAAGRFLRAMGVPVEDIDSLQGLDTLPATDEVLVITTSRLTLVESHYDRLFDWVRAGGHLIVRSRDFRWDNDREDWRMEGDHDPLLARLELGIEHVDYLGGPFEVPVSGADGPLAVNFDSWIRFTGALEDDRVIETESRTHLVHRRLGEGGVTVMGPMNFITNWNLGRHDHAEFLWHVVHLERTPARVWLVRFDEMPWLGTWLWRHAPELIVTLGLLFLAWLVAVGQRFGPLVPVAPPTRRRLLEHVEAAGHYLWRHDQRHALADDVRHALDARMCRVHPGWADLSTEERQQHLARLTGLPPTEIHELLHRHDHRHAQDFTRLIKTLETIRKQL
ncbi:MAG TPA: DUF4350 domain-containing protein [Thioalkalivibrio sp.]|nr:DUF4350 domain-containing protein [Thioalkalivibrio sp.]